MKKILGLDLGTNSIGWALIEQDFEKKEGKILGLGSRIIPMSQEILGEFDKGNSVSQTAERTRYRSVRRLRERHLLRRERLHRVLNVLGFLPKHYAAEIDFEKRLGKFLQETEPKLAWKKNEQEKFEFLFQNSFTEMVKEFKANGHDIKIPYDWTIYYLRKKALSNKLEKEELAWLILNFNQKRGYYQLRGEEEEENPNKLVELYSLKIVDVKAQIKYLLTLDNGVVYYRTSDTPLLNWKDTNHDFIVTTYLDENGAIKKDANGKEKRSYLLKEDLAVLKKKTTKPSKKNNFKVEEQSFKIVDVKEKKEDEIWYSLMLENGLIYPRKSKVSLFDWKDKVRDFIVTTDLNDDGTVKIDENGKEKRSFRSPSEDDWILVKKKTEEEIIKSQKTVGAYIYDTLLQKPNQKIRGKLVRTIERKFYKEELCTILKKQIELQPNLFSKDLYSDCVRELYRNNEAHQLTLSKRDFIHLFLDDIIFYQRPLKSQKSSIGNCIFEFRKFKAKDDNGKEIEKIEYLKAIPKSHPLYQEYRVWQWLTNLKIYRKDDDTEVTTEFIKSQEDKEKLFEFLMLQKEVNHEDILKHLIAQKNLKGKALSAEIAQYRWNYVYDFEKNESKTYPCNTTGYEIRRRLEKVKNVPSNFLTPEIEQHLWHIIYSVTDKVDFEKALKSFAKKHGLDETSFVDNFKKLIWIEKDYGSYSQKAIKKLLSLMRVGKYWNWDAIDTNTKNRIEKIITGEVDEEIKIRVREQSQKNELKSKNHFQGLPPWLASYVVYDRHSESGSIGKWNSAEDVKKYLDEFKQHSLRNPIVEQVVTETLRVVKDIWTHYGKGKKDFFDEIHIELGREMKNTAEDRKRITNQVWENENTNLRIKALIMELKENSDGKLTVEDVRPYSPTQQEILKIYEDDVLNSENELPDDIIKISKTAQPTKAELQRYKLWLEQKYRSPYTGEIIPLSKLFTHEYEIEHIIPQSRFFDDSFSNKVICEAAVNKLKDNQLGLEFIKNHHGEKVSTGFGKTVEIFSEENYKKFVIERFSKNRSKKNRLLLEDIPERMIERQINDTRYISKFISGVLSNIVRADKNDDGVNSKNIIPCNGKITSALRQDWGLNDVWNELILPRFRRMNELTKTNDFTSRSEKHQKELPTVPLVLSKGFQKKRIDHRHHALDALVIACATREHVNFMNNQHALDKTKKKNEKEKFRFDLRALLCDKKYNDSAEKHYQWVFKKPWDDFTVNAKNELEKIVISFKQNLRVINKTTNHYEKIEKGKKVATEQKGMNLAIRKSLHTPMPYGKRIYDFDMFKIAENIGKRELIIDKGIRSKVEEVYQQHKSKITDAQRFLKKSPIKDENGNEIISTAFKLKTEKFRRRQPITELSNRGQGGIKTVEDAVKFINKVADFKIREDLLNHLKECGNDLEKAFSTEGVEKFNSKRKIPVYKLPIAESGSGRFAVGNTIGTKHKWVEADKGTNLFFVVYERKDNKTRMFDTVPLNEVIEHQKQVISENIRRSNRSDIPIKRTLEDRNKDVEVNYLFYLSPNDLVYVPTEEEKENINRIDFGNLSREQIKRIYTVNDFSGSTCYFAPNHMAKSIAPKEVDLNFDSKKNKLSGSFDIKTASFEGRQIKDICIKLKVDRLGNISKA